MSNRYDDPTLAEMADEAERGAQHRAWVEERCRRAVNDLFGEMFGTLPRAKLIVSMDVSPPMAAELRRRYGAAPYMRYALPNKNMPWPWEALAVDAPPVSTFDIITIRVDVDQDIATRDVRMHYSDGETLLVPL